MVEYRATDPNATLTYYNWKSKSVAAMVLGIVSVACGIFLNLIPVINIVNLVISILAVAFGSKGRRYSLIACGAVSGMATAGLVLGIIGIIVAVLGILFDILYITIFIGLLTL